MRRAVFLDRDGTLIPDAGYLDTVAGVRLLPGVGEALRRLTEAGFVLVLATNQSGVARGYFDLALVHEQNARLAELLRPYGVSFAAVEVCPHHPTDGCGCRKPKPGMLARAATELGIDLEASFVVGDKAGDIGAARAAGCGAIALGAEIPEADFSSRDLAGAAQWILRQGRVEAGGETCV